MDTSPNAYSGGSLHVLFQIDSTFSSPYALIGADISGSKDSPYSGKSAFDMSDMTALTFMAKGSGTIYLQLTCMNPVDPRDFYLFELPVTLTSSWQRYSIAPEGIPNGKSIVTSTECTWAVGSSTVNNITFLAKKSADFWVDDIIVEGMNPTDFVKNQ